MGPLELGDGLYHQLARLAPRHLMAGSLLVIPGIPAHRDPGGLHRPWRRSTLRDLRDGEVFPVTLEEHRADLFAERLLCSDDHHVVGRRGTSTLLAWLAQYGVWERRPSEWAVEATFTHPDGLEPFTALTRARDPKELSSVMGVLGQCERGSVQDEIAHTTRASPLLPDLTTLQVAVRRDHGLSARHATEVAQGLYEKAKVISYPRTESRHLCTGDAEQVRHALARIATWNTGRFAPWSDVAAAILRDGPRNLERLLDSRAVGDHTAIVPTGALPPDDLSTDASAVLGFVLQTYLSALMGPFTLQTRSRRVRLGVAPVASVELCARASRWVEPMLIPHSPTRSPRWLDDPLLLEEVTVTSYRVQPTSLRPCGVEVS